MVTNFNVVRTKRSDQELRKHDYIVQLSGDALDSHFPDTSSGDHLLIRNESDSIDTAVHAPVYRRDDLELGDSSIGVDFSLRYALGVAAAHDIALDDGETEERDGDQGAAAVEADTVSVEDRPRPQLSIRHQFFNRLLKIRPEVCRVRMAVHPDLENRICRITGNTMELIGIEEGDNIVIESPNAVVTGVKAFKIDEESKERKQQQKKHDTDRYTNCYEELSLSRIRDTDVDIPDIYLDAEVRRNLELGGGLGESVCHPVRIYRDTTNLFQRRALDIVAPFAFALVSAVAGILNLYNVDIFGTSFSTPLTFVFVLALVLFVVTLARMMQIRNFLT